MPSFTSNSNLTHHQQLRIIQQNLGRRTRATDDLCALMINEDIDIAAIQEPHTFQNRVTCPTSLTLISSTSDQRPRSAILLSPRLKVIARTQVTTPDICTSTVTMKSDLLHVVSIYIPPEDEANSIEQSLQSLEATMNSLSGLILVCGDFNSHNTVWGSSRSDQRGRLVSDFISSANLHLLNDSESPTFFTNRAGTTHQSYIDLTLASTRLLPLVVDWEVNDSVTSSDHRSICIKLQLRSHVNDFSTTRRYVTGNINWTDFSCSVSEHGQKWEYDLSKVMSKEETDMAISSIIGDIVSICDATLPKMRTKKRVVPWWNTRLDELRRIARRWKRRCLRVSNQFLHETYLITWKSHQRKYEDALKKAKTDGWRKLLNEQNRETVWGKVYRLCKNTRALPQTTVKRSDGTYTDNAQSTADYLLDMFLPDDKEACLEPSIMPVGRQYFAG